MQSAAICRRRGGVEEVIILKAGSQGPFANVLEPARKPPREFDGGAAGGREGRREGGVEEGTIDDD